MTEHRGNGEGSDGKESNEKSRMGWFQVVGSLLAAAFGVQSQKNRERDFSHGDPKRFVITGIVLTVLFMVVVLGIVRLVLSL